MQCGEARRAEVAAVVSAINNNKTDSAAGIGIDPSLLTTGKRAGVCALHAAFLRGILR